MADETETGPYLGPQPFEKEHRGLFFGRLVELRQLYTMVLSNPVTLLYAGSGAGKTSLLRAGLLPLLEDEEDFQVLPIARVTGSEPDGGPPGANPFVRSVITSLLPESEFDVHAADLSMKDFLARLPRREARDGWSAPRLIVLDQLEEIFTLRPHHWTQRNEFFAELGAALHADPLLRVVLAIREDYTYELEPQRVRLPGRLKARFRLELLREAAAVDAVRLPVEGTARDFAPGVAERLVENLRRPASEPGREEVLAEFVEPVHLQVTCAALWRRLPPDRSVITVEDLRHFGDVDQALRSLYDMAIAAAAQKAGWKEGNLREEFADTFITSMDTRGTAYRSEHGVGGLPWEAVHVLEGRHLIRAEWRSNAHWYELTHDRFIGPIRRSNRRFVFDEITGMHEGERAVPVLVQRAKARDRLTGRIREPEPVPRAAVGPAEEEDEAGRGVALCLNGSGFRSMLFTAGVLWRICDAGLLPRLEQVSSHSGAAVTAALVGLGWEKLEFDASGRSARFEEVVVQPLRRLAGTSLDAKVVWSSVMQRRGASAGVADEYARRLFGEAHLGHLPDSPRFLFTCSHLASGEIWRFGKTRMGNKRVGWIKRPTTPVAVAVAASGANPPLLSPAILEGDGADGIVLTAGSVYDTLALETAWRRYNTVLVCDAKRSRPTAHLQRWRIKHFRDFAAASDAELHRLRRQQALLAYTSGIKKGGYWSINSDLANFPTEGALPCPRERTATLANLPGRLSRLEPRVQERLVNWGFAVTDVALRSHFDAGIAPAREFPYPAAGVG